MLIPLFVWKRTIRSWLVAPSPPLWINRRCNWASEASFSNRVAASAQSHDTPTYWSVESCCNSTAPTTDQISCSSMSMLSLLKTLSPNEENSYARQPFLYLFFWGREIGTTGAKKKVHRWFIKKNMKKGDPKWMRKTDFVSYKIRIESEWKDVRSGETGLSHRAQEPILIIRTRLNFRPHFFEASKPQKNHPTFFFLGNLFFISTQSRTWIHVNLHGYFFLHF